MQSALAQPQLEDFQWAIETILSERADFLTVKVVDNELFIHMDGTLSSLEREEVIDMIRDLDCLKNLDDWGAQIIDDWDRLDESDSSRRRQENSIKRKLARIVPWEIDFRGARLSWTMLARMCRWLGVNDTSTKLRIFIGMFPDDFDREKFIKDLNLDLPSTVKVRISTPGLWTKKGNLAE